jgi:hypothetical protein
MSIKQTKPKGMSFDGGIAIAEQSGALSESPAPPAALASASAEKIAFAPLPSLTHPLVTGLGGAIGCDFIGATNQLAFVEYSGNVSILNLIRPQVGIVSQGATVLHGTFIFDLETGHEGGGLSGPGDIWWEQEDAVHRRMVPTAGAQILNLGHVDYASLDSAALQQLSYGAAPIIGNNDATNQLTPGDVFAVKTNAGNFAKVLVQAYGYDLHIQWTTYKVGARYRVLGSGYANPEDIIVKSDGRHAFVTERSGTLLRVDLNNASRAMAGVVASGLHAPHQMQFDAGEEAIYLVEYDAPGRLLRINAASGAQAVIASGLDHPIGLLLSSDYSSAYVTEQSAAGGRVREVNLSNGAITPIATGFTAPFMMAWMDATQERFMLCERDPANRLAIVDLAHGNAVTRPGFPLGFRPSSLAVLPLGEALVCCDTEIDDLELGLSSAITGPLFKGIGNVPFDRIFGGLADTSGDPSYFYQVKNAPFGGVLPLRVNHIGAWIQGARYYKVLVDGLPRTDSWTDYKWNAVTNHYDLHTITSTNVPPFISNAYPVRSIAEALLWFNTDLGTRMDSVGYSDGMHTIEVQFFNAFGALLATSGAIHVRFENSSCTASLTLPHIGGTYAGADCGVLKYASGSDIVTLSFTAAQPHGFATYSFVTERGVHPLTPPSQSGNVTGAPITLSPTAAGLLGTCTIAGFAEYLYVYARAINGEYRQSQYDASASLAFVLAH